MQKIQDPITLDGAVPEKFTAGTVIRTVGEIEQYLHSAAMKFMEQSWNAAKPPDSMPSSLSHKRAFLNLFPELFKFREITVVYAAGVSSVDLTASFFFDVFDILDSRKTGGIVIEVWDQDKLADAMTGSNPFYLGSVAAPGMILQHPKLFVFPNSIADPAAYSFDLFYIQNVVNPQTGDILRTGGAFDIPFSEHRFETIADIAAGLYNKDDFQEDAGGE